jgi:hydrogenase nickel incorporation protein HypA/HybF
MHELSIVYSIVETVEQSVRETQSRNAPAPLITSVQLRIGTLSGVATEALRFAWDLGIAGTTLAGATLNIEELQGRELDIQSITLEIPDTPDTSATPEGALHGNPRP